MEGDLVSLLMLTLDRAEVTKRVLANNLWYARHPYELLVADNGSKDLRVVDFVAAEEPAYHRLNSQNEGVAGAFNQLMLRARGKWIVLLGNDILLPQDWLRLMLHYAQLVPKAGIVGMQCTTELPPLSMVDGVEARFVTPTIDKVFGTMLFSRELLDKVGGFYEGFNPYGCEDSDFNNRVNLAGFRSFYVPGLVSTHVCNDVGDQTEYRKMKNESLDRSSMVLASRVRLYASNGYYEPLPPLRKPI